MCFPRFVLGFDVVICASHRSLFPFFGSIPYYSLFCLLCCLRLGAKFLHYIVVSIEVFLGDFLIVNAEFAGCNFGYSTSNRWNGNSYEDNGVNCPQVTASKV